MFHHRKVIGQYQTPECPFCGKRALAVNSQKVPVCVEHKNKLIPEKRCSCGSWLDLRHGKYGPYFNCIKCGNLSYAKGTERASIVETKEEVGSKNQDLGSVIRDMTNEKTEERSKERTSEVVSPFDPRYF